MRIFSGEKSALTLAACALVVLAEPAPASVTVPGVTPPATAPFSAYTKAPIAYSIDPSGPPPPINMTCGSAAAAGGIVPKTTAGGLGAVSMHGTTLASCTGLGIDINFYHTPGSKWTYNAVTPNATNDVWTGTITNISSHAQSKVAGFCSFDMVGTAAATFTEAQVPGNNTFTQTLTVNQPATGALTITNVSGCWGQFSNGWPMTLTGSFKVYNSFGLINIQP